MSTLYDDDVKTGLCPSTPAFTSRYASVARSKPATTTVAPGLFSHRSESELPYLPEGWFACVQPEGQLYFACDSAPRTVTEAYMYTVATQEKVVHWHSVASKVIALKNIPIAESAELVLVPDFDNEDVCYYYFVDHATHVLFWLESVDTQSLGIPPVVSESHLRLALEELYWTNLEHFPSHRYERLTLSVHELASILLHAQGDQMTSETSTFSYSPKEYKNFLRIINAAATCLDKPPSVCVVARLWAMVARHRCQTHYGQEYARLGRDQTVLEVSCGERGRVFNAASHLLLGVPEKYAEELESLYVDEVAYVHPWRGFMTRCREEWKQHITWSLALAVGDVLHLSLPQASPAIALASLACCAAALIASLALLARHDRSDRWTAEEAGDYLYAAKHEGRAYARQALALSLPKAFFVWGVLIAALQLTLLVQRALGPLLFLAIVSVAGLACVPWTRGVRKLAFWRREPQEARDVVEAKV